MDRGLGPGSASTGRELKNYAAAVGRITSHVSANCPRAIEIARLVEDQGRAGLASVRSILKRIQDVLGPGAARAGAQLKDRAATQSVADGSVATKTGSAIEVSRAIHDQASLGIDTVARRLKVVKNFFRPQAAARGRQFEDGANATERTRAGGSSKFRRAIEIAGAIANEITVRVDAVTAARNDVWITLSVQVPPEFVNSKPRRPFVPFSHRSAEVLPPAGVAP